MTTFDLRTTALHLDGIGPITAHGTTGDFWDHHTRPEFRSGHILSVFEYTETWGHRERHPHGDELAIVVAGRAELLLDAGNGETACPLLPGQGAVIPSGSWHRVRTHEPTTMLFITPTPADTEHDHLDPRAESTLQTNPE